MWPWASFPGKQMLSDITVPTPFSKSFVPDGAERTTRNPQWVSSAHQKGKFSYIFRARGMPKVRIGVRSGSQRPVEDEFETGCEEVLPRPESEDRRC